jgi:DNA-binding IscR family transcriptional regulator
VPEFVDSAIKEIDDRLRALKDEASRLEAARTALIGARGGSGRVSAGRGRTQRSTASRRNGRSAGTQSGRSARGGGNTRAAEALELVRKQPGITIPEIAAAMSIKPNYLYRVLPQLASQGEVKRDGQGWHPGSSSTSAASTRSRAGSTPRRTRTARTGASSSTTRSSKSRANASATRSARTRRSNGSAPAGGGRTARGATKASVLAALAGGQAMTAGEVATKAGLARPTVSTTLSKLARSGEVQKAARGYRLAATG